MNSVVSARPGNLEELTKLVRGFSGEAGLIAGGTDLVIAMDKGVKPGIIIDLSGMKELSFVDTDEATGIIRIGAATPVSVLAQHPVIVKNATALAQAASQIGSIQIRNRATIGGNIASAMPAGDFLPVLKCLDCQIEILYADGHRKMHDFDDVVVGSGKTCLNNGDIITTIMIPRHHVSGFCKIGSRQMLTIAKLNLAVAADYQPESNFLKEIKIVAGAISATPLRLDQVEQRLRGRIIDQAFSDDFLLALSNAVDSAIPGRNSQAYKRHAIMGLGLDMLASLFDKTFHPPQQLPGKLL